MRYDALEGYYLQYKDSGKPVEVLDRVTYSFQSEDRTCLVQNPTHLAILLKTDRYRVIGVELANGADATPDVTTGGAAVVVTPKRRDRPRRGR